MKILNKLRLLALTLFLIITLCTNTIIVKASTISDELNITTSDYTLGKVYYDNFSMIAKKITSPLGIGYCLEINKSYPTGEAFTNKGPVGTNIKNIIASGYPVKSPNQLNLTSEDDAYFATQIAIWSYIEGYDVKNIYGDRPEILNAIVSIYNEALYLKNNKVPFNVDVFFTQANIQDVLILSNGIPPVEPPTPEIPTTPEVPPVIDDEPIYNGK